MGITVDSELTKSENDAKRLLVISDLGKQKLINDLMKHGINTKPKTTKNKFNLKEFIKKYLTWH